MTSAAAAHPQRQRKRKRAPSTGASTSTAAAAAAAAALACLALLPTTAASTHLRRQSTTNTNPALQNSITSANTTAEILAACDCGYTDTSPGADNTTVWNSWFKADFTDKTRSDISYSYRYQNYSIARANADLRRDFRPENVALCDEGLCLTVRPLANATHIPSGGIYTKESYGFGNYYTEVKVPSTPGTVSAFYIYLNDENEVDMEYNNPSTTAVESIKNTVKPQLFSNNVPSPETYFQTFAPPGVDLADGFHTWSFQWSANEVRFALDGDYGNTSITTNIPQMPGVLAFSHCPFYSGGPPNQPTVLTFRSSWAYWNNASLPSTLPCQRSSAPCRFDARRPAGSTTDVPAGAATKGLRIAGAGVLSALVLLSTALTCYL